ncbi:MAG: glycine betaine ABC transporter substrate-binding protein [Bacillota bacterium]
MFKQRSTLIAVVLMVAVLISGCSGAEDQQGTSQQSTDEQQIKLGYVQWASAEASTHLMAEVLKQAGYDVETMILQAGAMYEGTAKGDLDAFVCAWLPQTQKSYWEKNSDQLVDLGANFTNAKLGLVVPEYVEVDSIAQLKENSSKFNQQIVGIDPGAGIMQTTKNKGLDAYGLSDWKLIESSGPAMTAKLEKAVKQQQPVVVTGWTPHWKWAEFDLKFLKDPQGVYGAAETIRSIGRSKIKEDFPTASKILTNYELTTDQLGRMMNLIQQGNSPEEAAKKFIKNHQELVNSWLPKGVKLK